MNFFLVVIILFAISLLWALYSVARETGKPREIEKARRALARERVIFHR